MPVSRPALAPLLLAVALAACECGETPGAGSDVDGGGGGGVGIGDGGDGSGTAGRDAGFGPALPDGGIFEVRDGGVVVVEDDDAGTTFVCYQVVCDGHLTECADCADNDGDGRTDFRDPECLGPCDNTEGPGLFSGVGGANGNSCGVDCYFDYGNGPGNDDCHWDHRCDPLEPEDICAPYQESRVGTSDCPDVQSQLCESYCRPFTPNGCDCFGCCTFPALDGEGPDGGPAYVWIGNLNASNESTCTLDAIDDEAACPRCTPVGNCLNECGRCEVCIGKPDVPDDCFTAPPPVGPGADGGVAGGDGGPGGTPGDDGGAAPPSSDAGFVNPDQCGDGVQACGLPGQEPCAPGNYCISGCCVFVPG